MYFLEKIVMFHTFLNMAIALKSIDLAGSMNITWTQLTPHTHKTPYNNNYQPSIYDIYIGVDSYKLALLSWHYLVEDYPSRPNLTITTHNFNGSIDTRTCDVDSPSDNDNKWVFAESVLFLKNNKVLISWRADHKIEGLRISSQVIFIDSCKSSDFINVNTELDLKHNFVRAFHMVVRFKDSFDIIFKYERICPKDYCNLSFNYNGEPLSTSPLPFSKLFIKENETLYINSIFTMENDSKTGVVITGNKNGIFYSPTNGQVISHDVYSPILGWIKAEGLYHDHHIYSNSSGFATLCWIQSTEEKFCCKWIDGTHRNEDGLEKTLILKMKNGSVTPWISNIDDGQIIIMKPGFKIKKEVFFIDKINIDGQCKRLMEITHDGQIVDAQLSITKPNEFCFSFVIGHITNNKTGIDLYIHTYSFITKCINITNEDFDNSTECKKDYT